MSVELMLVAAAREITDGAVCFVGVGQPSQVALIARHAHAPHAAFVYESGVLGAEPSRPPLSVADEDLVRGARVLVPVHEVFNYWLQGGRIGLGIIGAAQVDRFGNVNSTVIGAYASPRTRLPGAGGAPTIAGFAGRTVVVTRHSRRSLVDRVDFVSTLGRPEVGAGRGPLGLSGAGVTTVVTDLGVLRLDVDTGELVLTRRHPGVKVETVQDATGWPLRAAADVVITEPPSPAEAAALEALG